MATDGFVVVDKPGGMTSHDVVAVCRRRFGQKRVGHAGTLDPDATGVLLVALGRATRLLQFVSGLTKSYEAEVVLGVATSTLDAAGETLGRWDMTGVTLEQARVAASGLTGDIWQVPPMVSAVKVGGRRLHQLARQGLEVDRPARQVTVSRFSVDGMAEGPVLRVSIDCSAGTYVRVLAADLGAALGGGAHVRSLRRSAVGPWSTADAVRLDRLDPAVVRPPRQLLPGMEVVAVGTDLARAVSNGAVLERAELGADGEGPWGVVGPDGTLLAVYAGHRSSTVKPIVVVSTTERDDGEPGHTR